ncbi:hypothetical protein ES704_03857 [subsurface metagenome]
MNNSKSGYRTLKKNTIKFLTLIVITQIFLSSIFLITNGYGDPIEIKVGFGAAPVIDGIIDGTTGEWDQAKKQNINLYPNISVPENGLAIDLWVIQEGLNLYILVRFDLQDHGSSKYDNEFIGILIADEGSNSDFTDAKIVQYSNISENTFQYLDYHINDTEYEEDIISNGAGAANLEENQITYEFSMPVKNTEDEVQDVYLNYQDFYDFKIVFGNKTALYPDDIMISNIVSLYLEYKPGGPDIPLSELIMFTSTIVIFSIISALYIFYIYRITQLKKEIRRIRS